MKSTVDERVLASTWKTTEKWIPIFKVYLAEKETECDFAEIDAGPLNDILKSSRNR